MYNKDSMSREVCENCCWAKSGCSEIETPDFVRTDTACMKKVKLNYLYNQALVPEPLRKPRVLVTDADKTDKMAFMQLAEISSNIVEFVKTGGNLYIHSTRVGNGKTSWALRMIQSYFGIIWPKAKLTCKALFINVPRFLNALKDNIREKDEYAQYIKENMYEADLVVWDDIGTKVATPYEMEMLFSILDTRLNMGKSNIFTSNLSAEELEKALGPRLFSRVVNTSIDVELKGTDKRGIKL